MTVELAKNIRDLVEPSWESFWKGINEHDLCRWDINDTPYSLKVVRFHEHEENEEVYSHQIEAEFTRSHCILPFSIAITLYIDPGSKDVMKWFCHSDMHGIVVLGKFVDFPILGDYAQGEQSFQDFFSLFLTDLDFALTKLTVHPDRDEFMDVWKGHYGTVFPKSIHRVRQRVAYLRPIYNRGQL